MLFSIYSWRRWGRDRFFERPSVALPTGNCCSINLINLAPSGKVFCNAVDGAQNAATAVSALRFPVGPPAIFFAIPKFIVNAVESCLWMRAIPHIFKKKQKVVPPSFANRDPSPAVMLPRRVTGVGASPYHMPPNSIFRSLREAMRSAQSACIFPAQAPTTFCSASANLSVLSYRRSSTVALAVPVGAYTPIGRFRDYCKSGDFVAYVQFTFKHVANCIILDAA